MTRYEPRYRLPEHRSDAAPVAATTISADSGIERNCALSRALHHLRFCSRPKHTRAPSYARLPPPSQARLEASLHEQSIDISALEQSARLSDHDPRPGQQLEKEKKEKTVLYLAYGSNLSTETFRRNRGIQPLAQLNVVVPTLRLTFDLPGIPYTEPCFANTAVRDPDDDAGAGKADYHKNRWHKGLVGCVYEVTLADYAHIIATEGGGASYQDVLVECYALPEGSDVVPQVPEGDTFLAHTLFAPVGEDESKGSSTTMSTTRKMADVHSTARFSRPDPAYAQPSARYLKLLTDGASELSLPSEYQSYLSQIRAYTITSRRQAMGQKLFTGLWLPFLMFVFALQRRFQDDKGRAPDWLVVLSGWLFAAMWGSYDAAFKKVFGDGERTEGEGEDDDARWGGEWRSHGWRAVVEREKMSG